jgi:hypothetical protein
MCEYAVMYFEIERQHIVDATAQLLNLLLMHDYRFSRSELFVTFKSCHLSILACIDLRQTYSAFGGIGLAVSVGGRGGERRQGSFQQVKIATPPRLEISPGFI